MTHHRMTRHRLSPPAWPAWSAALLALALAHGMSQAHAPSNAYLTLQIETGQQVSQRLDVALRDLDRELHLDANDDGRITWGELRTRWAEVDALTHPALALHQGSAEGPACSPGALDAPRVDPHSDGAHAVLTRRWQCPAPVTGLALRYSLFADSDPTHRAIVQLRTPTAEGGPSVATAVVTPGEPARVVGATAATATAAATEPTDATMGRDAPAAAEAPPSSFAGFVAEGVHHILIGTDHVLFLLCLLLPAVLVAGAGRRPGATPLPALPRMAGLVALPSLPWQGAAAGQADAPRWHAAPELRPVLLDVARTVTAFTVAHSITLALAVLGVVTPPTRWVESLIAISVALTALDNLRPMLPAARWKLTFLFGLVHGFGFAGALGDLGLGGNALASALLGFNLGVEIGQLGIVALFLPLAWWLRGTRFYQRVVLGAGSAVIALVALGWVVERVWEVKVFG